MIVNREAVWQVLRMYYVGGKLLNRIKSMHVDIQACARVKWGYSEWFRIIVGKDRVYHFPLAVKCIYGCSNEGVKMRIGRRGRVGIAWALVCRRLGFV